MFSRKSSLLGKKLSLRFVIVLVFSNILMILSVFFFLKNELANKDKSIAMIRFHEVYKAVESHGVDILKDQKEISEFIHFGDLLIRIIDADGNILFEKLPQKIDNFEKKEIEKSLLLAQKVYGNHTIYPQELFEETIELYSGLLNNYTIIVGINTDSSEDILNFYFKWAIIFSLISSIISVLVGYYSSSNLLKPIRELIFAVKSIRSGDFATKLEFNQSGDELSELTLLFNQMIEKIRGLIVTQQASLDAIAHDLRTPLTHIVNKLELKLREAKTNEVKEILGEILEETHSISSLVNNLLELTEAESSIRILKLETVNLFDSIKDCVDIYEFVIEEKKASVQIICSDKIFIAADRNKFRRLLANLIDNALKFSNSNPQIIISHIEDQNYHFINIIDNGRGITEEESKQIWNRLYRGDSSRNTSGSGLGLSYVMSLVEIHGWKIELISKQGAGAHFRIKIGK